MMETCCNGGHWSLPIPQARTCCTDRLCELNPSWNVIKVMIGVDHGEDNDDHHHFTLMIITIVNPNCNMIKVIINMILLMMMKFMTLKWTNSLVYLLQDRVPL